MTTPRNSRSSFFALGRALLFIVGCAIVLAAVAPITATFPSIWRGLALGAFSCLGAFALTLLFVRYEKLKLADVGAAPEPGSLWRLGIGFVIGLFLLGVWISILGIGGRVRWIRETGIGFREVSIAFLTFFALASREEIAFRGYPLRHLAPLLGLWPAQIIVAFVFGVEHKIGGMTWQQALLGAGVGSLLFGMAAMATRGLAVPIGLHAAWNFGDWILGGKNFPGLWKRTIDQGNQARAEHIATIGYLVVMGGATVAFWLLYRRRETCRHNMVADGDQPAAIAEGTC